MSQMIKQAHQFSDEKRGVYESPSLRIIRLHTSRAMMQVVSNGENLNVRSIDDDDFWA